MYLSPHLFTFGHRWATALTVGLLLVPIIFRIRIGPWDPTLVLLIISGLMCLTNKGRIPSFIVRGSAVLGLAVAYVWGVTVLTKGVDTYLVLKYPRAIISFFSVCMIISFLVDRYRGAVSAASIYFCLTRILLLHPLFMLLQLAFPDFNAWMATELPSYGAYHDERARGLAPGTSSGGQLLGFISLFYFWMAVRFRRPAFAVVATVFLPLFPLSALAGGVPWSLGFLYWFSCYGAWNLRSAMKCGLVVILILGMLVGVMTLIRGFDLVENRLTDAAVRVGALMGVHDEPVSHGDPRESVNNVIESYSLPPAGALGQWLFGYMHEKGGAATFNSDAGVVRFLHVYGVIGSGLMISIIAWFSYKSRNAFIWLFFLAYMILQVKNHMLFGRMVFDLFFAVFALSQIDLRAHDSVRRDVSSVAPDNSVGT